MDKKKLIETAIKYRKKSYSPYSKYKVGAAVLMDSGNIYGGNNIENASYPAGICAERTAIFKAVSEGEKTIKAIAICGGSKEEIDDMAYPCGICRQVIREFSDPKECIVIIAKSADDYEEYTLEQLLPNSFGPDNLS